ncbi:MAG TPA: glycosyltransferase [Candidatus Acidoferrum sp.]|jgi:cellulose synthase/poly-beta-1,6-N-acetylglucosamine synthase-like glycosyltransferase
MLFVFWLCLLTILYVYFGYPALLAGGVLGKRRETLRAPSGHSVSILIPAFNEEANIQAKLANVLAQDYDRGPMEVLVGSDGSTDSTARMVQEFPDRRVRLIDSKQRRGKSAVQNDLAANAHGSFLVFTDADCMLPENAISQISSHFADPIVGLVTNCAAIDNESETGIVQSEGIYWKYEKWLREQESARGLLAVASGSLFGMRRELWSPLDDNVGDDFVFPLQVVRHGYLNVLDGSIRARTRLTQNKARSMLRMKVRIISKDLRGLLTNHECLNPFKVGRIAVGLWSHKLLRWAIPYFLIGLLVSTFFLSAQPLFRSFLVVQLLFYGLSLLGLLVGSDRFRFPISVASSFCLVNLAALFGTLHCLSFRTAGQWKTVR